MAPVVQPMPLTPPLPAWITDAHVNGYVNAHQELPGETRLYGTESLYGDWNGRVLLIAKDFAPSKVLRTRLAKGDARPYRHEPGLRTNVRLERMTGRLRTGAEPENCGLLYGSALANLLRDDGIWSGTLPNRGEAMAYGVEVLRFTRGSMPNLDTIVCMGEEAWEVTATVLGITTTRAAARDGGGTVQVGGVTVVAVPHPAARISNVAHERAWVKVVAR